MVVRSSWRIFLIVFMTFMLVFEMVRWLRVSGIIVMSWRIILTLITIAVPMIEVLFGDASEFGKG